MRDMMDRVEGEKKLIRSFREYDSWMKKYRKCAREDRVNLTYWLTQTLRSAAQKKLKKKLK